MHKFISRLTTPSIVLFSLFFLGVTSTPVLAQSDQGLASRQFGQGQPKKTGDLPPGQLKRSLEDLPPQASARALKWLQDIEFTGGDLDQLKVDQEGGVFFEDTLLPEESVVEQAASTAAAELAPSSTLANAFKLHSLPGASNVVFVDFDGHVFTNTAWGSGSFYALPYDLDGNNATFSDTERGRIVDIWHRIAEDLAPFDIDVTTEEPDSFDRYTGRILITRDVDATGKALPGKGAGGVAYVGVFGSSSYHTYYSPALVYYNNLAGGGETYVAEASSHEFGHNLGLSHDGKGGSSPTNYYSGHGSDLVSWAPIMGNGYSKNVTEWSKGEYPDANQKQDDLAIIENKLGLKPDDHGDAIGSGTSLLVAGNGSVVSSNPELDPDNLLPENKGIINTGNDVDVFTFTAGAGPVSLSATPAWDAFYAGNYRRGANLDIQLELRNASGGLVTSNNPSSNTSATVSATVPAGTYHLLVTGVGKGNLSNGYSDYASLGQYFINGSMAPSGTDSTPPNPNPMAWASDPVATGQNSISMTAVVATDETSSVQYDFRCVAGGSGCTNSGWKTSNSHTASGLAAGTSYSFNVIARDAAQNTTSASPTRSATTQSAADNTPPNPDPMSWANAPAATGQNSIAMTATTATDAVSSVKYNFRCVSGGAGCVDSGWVTSSSYTANGLEAATGYTFEVLAQDEAGNTTVASVPASATTTAPPPPPPSSISLDLSSNRAKSKVIVKWGGANGTKVDIHRNGSYFKRTRNDGKWADRNVSKGSTYRYRVCERGSTTVCSAEVSFTL